MNMIYRLFAVIVIVCQSTGLSTAQSVVRCPNQDEPFVRRWEWAIGQVTKQSAVNGSVWIGYEITKPMRRNSVIGTIYSDARKNSPSLCEVLALDVCVKEHELLHSMHNFTMSEGTTYFGDDNHGDEIVQKEIAILFEVPSDHPDRVKAVVLSNISLHVELHESPLLWIGEAKSPESLAHLESTYESGVSDKTQKKIITAIGQHEAGEEVIGFLSNIGSTSDAPSLRADATYWLGQTNSEEALKLLVTAAENETSNEVREQAVYAISEMDHHMGTEALITLARTGKNREIRSKAMYALGQQASEKATATLKGIVENDEDTEIQKSALYALTQSGNNEGIDELITIAQTHHNPEIRKQAIYLLGESDDKRALDVLVGIIRKQ